jgi:hypothetical protein
MLPRNFSARIVLVFSLALLSLVSVHFRNNAASQTGLLAYCASGLDQSPVYVTQIFNTGLNPNYIADTAPLQNEYNEYLKGRFGANSNSPFPVACWVSTTMSQAQAGKNHVEAQARQGNKQVVEIDWNYRPEPGGVPIPTSQPSHSVAHVPSAPADRMFCVSDQYQGTVYFTGPVMTTPPVAVYQWTNGFTAFLKAKYSFDGHVFCNMGSAVGARRLVDAHLDGSRAAGHRVVQTDWKFDASQTASASPSRPSEDEDREPAQRPAVQPANLQARDFAIKEHPRALAFCVGDRPMAAAFDCTCLVRQISQYRLSHVSDTLSASPTPLEELYKGDRFDCKSCIQVDWKFKPGIKSVARFQRPREGEADCVVDKMRTLLEAKPYPSQTRALLNEAMAACR